MVLIASLIGPVTRRIGLVPTAVPTHTEPFHLASAFATLDYVSNGRAGWRPQVSGRQSEAAHVGFHTFEPFEPTELGEPAVDRLVRDLFHEATDAVKVVRRLWDSWEDDAIIKDKPTGRYIDRDKLHYVDFEGRFFSVKGPAIVPRPPQGRSWSPLAGPRITPSRGGRCTSARRRTRRRWPARTCRSA